MIKLKKILLEKKYLFESKFPPGIDSSNIISWEEFTKEDSFVDENEKGLQKISSKVAPSFDTMADYVRSREKDPTLERDYDLGIVHKAFLIDKEGKNQDSRMLIQLITDRPNHLIDKNSKIKKSGLDHTHFYNTTLPAYRGIYYDEEKKEFRIVTICSMADICKWSCYALNGVYIVFKDSFLYRAKVITYIMNNWEGYKSQLKFEIQERERLDKSKNFKTALRWHDSGEMINKEYFEMIMDIARDTPEIDHYAYTKNVSMANKAKIPPNFEFAYSLGGTQDNLIRKGEKKAYIIEKDKFKPFLKLIGTAMNPNKKGKPHREWIKQDVIYHDGLNSINAFKKSIAKDYKVPLNTVITYNELVKIPYDRTAQERKWNVIVTPIDGDDAGMRKDVAGIFLLKH